MVAGLSVSAAPPVSVDEAFKQFWAASNPQEAAKAADDVVKSGVAFGEAYAQLKRGRAYSADVPKGVVRLKHHFALGDFWYSVEVPQDYNPERPYQVRVQLHGGVGGRDNGQIRATGSIGALAGVDQIYVMPTSWSDAPWWSDSQIENLRAVLDSVKRTYNVDENRINMAGVSDGATGTYYFAMRDTTPYSSFESLNGSLGVLQNPTIGRDGALFPNNLLNKPYFIVNGALDPLYPTDSVEPYINHLKSKGVDILYRPEAEGEHNTKWWPDEKDPFEEFVHEHPRKPYPDRLTWETDLAGDVKRAHWLIINDVMNKPDPRQPLPDVNIFVSPNQDDPGERIPPLPLFPTRKLTGRVDLEREGNTIRATTRGVADFTLLISPDVFDFDKPIKVIADGKTVFDGKVKKSLETLMKWAAHDNDRTMLFGAELDLKLPAR
jgi:hypothetical protein